VVFDIETTGLRRTDRIVEFACAVVDDDGTISCAYETLVNPGRGPGPTRVHGLSAEALASAPTFADVAGDIQRQFRDRVPVAHNLGFDWAILRAELERLGVGVPPSANGICTARLASVAGLEVHRLGDVCRALGLEATDLHTAAGDVRAAAAVFGALRGHVARLPTARPCAPFQGSWRLRRSSGPVARSQLTVRT
jgi:DNA polymerase III epsilon subunit-like protein